MISLSQIERMIEHGSHAQLIRRILANGRCTCPAIREHLLGRPGGPDTPIIAAGLALQRCCELSYGLTDLAGDLAMRLITAQMPDGRLGIADDTALAATAIALRGLIEYRDQLAGMGGGSDSERETDGQDPKVDTAIERGMSAVSHLVNLWANSRDHATGILIAVWQLGHLPSFRACIDVDRVLMRLRERYARDLDARLVDYAFAQAA